MICLINCLCSVRNDLDEVRSLKSVAKLESCKSEHLPVSCEDDFTSKHTTFVYD